MKVIFTSSSNPNFFSRLIVAADGSEYTHCAIDTGLIVPELGSERLLFHCSAYQGATIEPMTNVLGTKKTQCFENPEIKFHWGKARDFLRRFRGADHYGFQQNLAIFLKSILRVDFGWRSGMNCVELFVRMAQVYGCFPGVDPDRVGVRETISKMKENNFEPCSILD